MSQQLPFYTDRMFMGSNLQSGQYLVSKNKQYYAIMQTDGNFVVYANPSQTIPPPNGNKPLWHTHSNGKGQAPHRFTLQTDGNLVVYDNSNSPLWSPYKASQDQFRQLIMQDDGNLCLYDQNNVCDWNCKNN